MDTSSTSSTEQSAAEKSAPTRADRLEALEHEFGGHWDRAPQPGGAIRLRFHFATGEAIAGNGATTEDALVDLERRVRAYAVAIAAAPNAGA